MNDVRDLNKLHAALMTAQRNLDQPPDGSTTAVLRRAFTVANKKLGAAIREQVGDSTQAQINMRRELQASADGLAT